jgi:hypothetical protein
MIGVVFAKLFGQMVLSLARSAIDPGNPLGRGPAADSPAQSAW